VTADLDTLLTALYVFVGDHVVPPETRRPGRPKRVTDAELMCLAVAEVLLGFPSQAHWPRLCYCRLGGMFGYLPKQPGYCKRLNNAAALMDKAMHMLAAELSAETDEYRLLDATAIPCGTSRPTAQRSRLAGWANYGYRASHSRWYWGLKLYLITTAHGMPVVWWLADPTLGEREVARKLLGHAHDHALPPAPLVLIARQRLRWSGLRTPSRASWASGSCAPTGATSPTATPTPAGVYARITQRLLALAAAIWHNCNTAVPTARSLIAYDH